jgi:hypothetical protein
MSDSHHIAAKLRYRRGFTTTDIQLQNPPWSRFWDFPGSLRFKIRPVLVSDLTHILDCAASKRLNLIESTMLILLLLALASIASAHNVTGMVISCSG